MRGDPIRCDATSSSSTSSTLVALCSSWSRGLLARLVDFFVCSSSVRFGWVRFQWLGLDWVGAAAWRSENQTDNSNIYNEGESTTFYNVRTFTYAASCSVVAVAAAAALIVARMRFPARQRKCQTYPLSSWRGFLRAWVHQLVVRCVRPCWMGSLVN